MRVIGSPARRPKRRLLHRRHFRGEALVWLEGFFCQIGVELSQLARVGDIILVRCPGVFALHPERFIQRLGTDQIFHRLGAALE